MKKPATAGFFLSAELRFSAVGDGLRNRVPIKPGRALIKLT